MNHMIRHIRNPNFCFPSKCFGKLLKSLKIKERSYINFTRCNTFCHFFNLFNSLRLHRPDRSNRLDKIKPILFFRVKDYIWHFIVKCNCKSQFLKLLYILNQIFFRGIPYIKALGIRCKSRRKFLNNSLL